MQQSVTAGSGRAPGSGGRVVRRGCGRAVEHGGGQAVECGSEQAVKCGGGRAVERGSSRVTEEDEDRTETRARDKDGDKEGGTGRVKDGHKDKDKDKTETRTETRTRTRTGTRRRQGHGDGVNKLLRTDLRRATALIIYRNSCQHPNEQTPTRANTDTFHDPHILTSQHIPSFPCPGVLHPFVLEPSLAFPFFPHFCGPATSALHVIQRRDTTTLRAETKESWQMRHDALSTTR